MISKIKLLLNFFIILLKIHPISFFPLFFINLYKDFYKYFDLKNKILYIICSMIYCIFFYYNFYLSYSLCQPSWYKTETIQEYCVQRSLMESQPLPTTREMGIPLGLCANKSMVDKNILLDIKEIKLFFNHLKCETAIKLSQERNPALVGIFKIMLNNKKLLFDESWYLEQMKNMAIERIRLNDFHYWDRTLLLQFHEVFVEMVSFLESLPQNPFLDSMDEIKIPCVDNILKKKLYPHKFNNLNISVQTEFDWQRDSDSSSASSSCLTYVSTISQPRSSMDQNERLSINSNEFIQESEVNFVDQFIQENTQNRLNDLRSSQSNVLLPKALPPSITKKES